MHQKLHPVIQQEADPNLYQVAQYVCATNPSADKVHFLYSKSVGAGRPERGPRSCDGLVLFDKRAKKVVLDAQGCLVM